MTICDSGEINGRCTSTKYLREKHQHPAISVRHARIVKEHGNARIVWEMHVNAQIVVGYHIVDIRFTG